MRPHPEQGWDAALFFAIRASSTRAISRSFHIFHRAECAQPRRTCALNPLEASSLPQSGQLAGGAWSSINTCQTILHPSSRSKPEKDGFCWVVWLSLPGDPVPPSSFARLFRLLHQTMGKWGQQQLQSQGVQSGRSSTGVQHANQANRTYSKTYRKNDGAVGWGGRQHLGRILFVRALSQREPAIDVIRRAVNAPPLRCLAQHGLS